MDLSFVWVTFFVLVMILLLEAVSLLPIGSLPRRLTMGALLVLTTGVVGITSGVMLGHQLPSFSFTLPTFVLSLPS